ncbi:hypothetical protein HHK36_023874 [Tetracentron sinense]|uniref:F-box protein n=1 Tax=Tetracentron sinense TaxID=13715 RepID=A0A834YRX6_TETSI|nr:hypothetical protein HHK36_023874 [Tetracentron sinense]
MATLQARLLLSSSISSSPFSSSSSTSSCARSLGVTFRAPRLKAACLSLPKYAHYKHRGVENPIEAYPSASNIPTDAEYSSTTATMVEELYAIAEIVADRAEMHANVGEQRNNWNNLLLISINAITLTAATMVGLAATVGAGTPLLAFKLSSTLLYTAATGMLLVINKIQPSQLAEEQRNASRLFRQLHEQIHTRLALRAPTSIDVKSTTEKVLALDKAYPLPLLGGMREKFPTTIDPAVWWPVQLRLQGEGVHGEIEKNGWSENLEQEMREIVGVLKRKDTAEYVRLSKLVSKTSRILSISGPLLTGIAAIVSTMVGSPLYGSWAVLIGVAAGAVASVVNTLEHGGQIGMVFEMYRNNAGFYRLMEESIESALSEKEVERRENGELFEMKVALQLGRIPSDLRDLASASSSCTKGDDHKSLGFAGKLF